MKKGLSKMEKREIERKAKEVLIEFGYNPEKDDYVDAVRLAKSVGFKVGESDKLSDDEDGFIVVSPDESLRVIGINHFRNFAEKRFIVIHELAHYFLHKETLKKQVMLREHKKGKNTKENDADYFAACVLMPSESFCRQAKKYSSEERVERLERMFLVPTESVVRRLSEVGIE